MTWPLVDPHDDGIRPASKPDECLYCRQRIGQPHERECVIVTKRVEMRVVATLPTGEKLTGTWQFDEVYSWDEGMTEFHKNESSWCASNFLHATDHGDVITWDPGSEGAMEKLEWLDTDKSCLCNVLEFTFVRVIDGTPRRKLRMPEAKA